MDKTNHPLVSVVVATRNRPELLERALKSIAQQSYDNFEVIIVDDGSDESETDAYKKIFDGLDEKFRLERVSPPGSHCTGPATARNVGIFRAKGEFVAFLDHDDIWIAPDHLAVAIAVLQQENADYYFTQQQGERDGRIILGGDFHDVDANGLTAGRRVYDTPPVFEVSLAKFAEIIMHHNVHPDVEVIKRALLTEIGGFYERIFFCEDLDLAARVADKANKILYRPECTSIGRLPVGGSHSLSFTKMQQSLNFVHAMLHIRITCKHKAIRRAALRREGWCKQEISGKLLKEKDFSGAINFAWDSLKTNPTFGALAYFMKVVLRSAIR